MAVADTSSNLFNLKCYPHSLGKAVLKIYARQAYSIITLHEKDLQVANVKVGTHNEK